MPVPTLPNASVLLTSWTRNGKKEDVLNSVSPCSLCHLLQMISVGTGNNLCLKPSIESKSFFEHSVLRCYPPAMEGKQGGAHKQFFFSGIYGDLKF